MSKIIKQNSCWIWTGATSNKYGRISIGYPLVEYAHRVSYILHKGPIKNQLDHLCMNKSCINPDHLEDVTGSENMLRRPRSLAAKKACINGHPYNEANEYKQGNSKACRKCHAERERKRRLAIKQKSVVSY